MNEVARAQSKIIYLYKENKHGKQEMEQLKTEEQNNTFKCGMILGTCMINCLNTLKI